MARLERELAAANGKIASLESNKHSADVALVRAELEGVKLQLDQKSALLDKIKVLLHKAAVREKELLDEVWKMKSFAYCNITCCDVTNVFFMEGVRTEVEKRIQRGVQHSIRFYRILKEIIYMIY